MAVYYKKNNKKKVDIYSERPLLRLSKLISVRSVVIFTQILLIPLMVTGLWLLIPLHSYVTFYVSVGVYQYFSFLVWSSVFDLTLPGTLIIHSLVLNIHL